MKKNYTNLSAINIYNRETGYYCPLKIKLFILLFFLFVQTTFSQTFNPVADAYVRDGSYAGTNYGNATTLVVKTGSSGSSGFTRWSYIKFDLTGSGISTAISAKLRLYATAAASFTIGAYKSSSNGWTETGINWNNKPSPGALISSAPISAKNVWYEWDVTSYVTSQLSIGIYSFSFLMKDIAAAVKDAGFSSKESSLNKPQLVIITTAPPVAPTSLTTTPVSTSQINLAWNDNAGDETNYAVERKTGSGSYSVIATLPDNTIAYSNTGLAEATSYTYRVKAINAGGSSGYSNESTSATLLSLPNQPISLQATAVSSSQINLNWVDNATNESGYKIEQSMDNGFSFTEIASTGANVTSYNKTGLTPLTLYVYRVRAFNATGYSNYSNEYSATTLAPSVSPEYYIDAINGNDANTGTSSAAPWKNLSKLNVMTLGAGTKIFLRAGSVWTGQQLKFKGSGNAANPIVVDKYDAGAKPILHGNGLVGQGVVYLYNQEYIEINNLEITNSPNGTDNSIFFTGLYQNGNNPLGADRRGVMVVIDNFGTANYIYLKNLDIHHIKGQLGSGETSVNGAVPKRTGGIYFCVLGSTETSGSKSRFNDVLIDQCNIYYCENVGLAFNNDWNVYYPGSSEYNDWYSRRFTNIKVSNNIIHHIGKNAMIIRCTDETGLIERNVCYETALGTTGNTMFTARAKGTVFQYNEGYYNRATTQNVNPGNNDGSMYDADFGSVGIIFQYSYSHNNSHGLYWGCNTRGSANNTSGTPDPGDTACTVRYNISQNDQGDLIYFNYPSAGNRVYNNVFYIGAGLSSNIIHENSSKQHTYEFYNNIIYNLSSTADYAFATSGQTRYISNNVFYGNHPTGSTTGEPADPNKIILDPLFVNPGSATTNINSTAGYQLQSSSPAINKGKIVPNNGGLDYWGNSLYMGLPDIGAYEYPAGGTTSRNINNNIGMEAQGNDLKSGFDFKIYPNPATNRQLNIILPVNSSFSDVNISVLTTDGKEVYHSKVIGGKFIQLNLPTQMSNGIYLLKLKTANSVLTKPFIYDPGN